MPPQLHSVDIYIDVMLVQHTQRRRGGISEAGGEYPTQFAAVRHRYDAAWPQPICPCILSRVTLAAEESLESSKFQSGA